MKKELYVGLDVHKDSISTAPGSVVVFDYGTEANIEAYRKTPLGLLGNVSLKAVREPQTFWISSEPPVKNTVAALMCAYGLSLREQLDYGRETKRKPSRGGLAAAAVLSDLSNRLHLMAQPDIAEFLSLAAQKSLIVEMTSPKKCCECSN